MDLREEQLADEPAVDALHRAAFGDHGVVVTDLLDGLRRDAPAGSSLSLLALEDERVVGHVMFRRSLLDAPPRLVDVQVLSPVAALPERQGRGVASALIKRGLDVLDHRGVPLVFLEGPPGCYARFGSSPGAGLGFRKPSLRIPDAAFQVLALRAHEPWMTGTLVYSETFWRHDAVGLRDGH